MQTKICKVIAQTEPVYVQSKKTESGQLAKCYIRLRELGGACTQIVDDVQSRFGYLARTKFAMKYPAVDEVRRATLQIIPQLKNAFHMNYMYRDYVETDYLQDLLKLKE